MYLEVGDECVVGLCVDFFDLVFETLFSREKVSNLLVVDLKETGLHLVAPSFLSQFSRLVVNLFNGPRDDSFGLFAIFAFHCEGLAASSLSVREDADVVAIDGALKRT